MTVVAYGVDHGVDGLLNVILPPVDHSALLKAQQSPLLGARITQISQVFR